MNLIMAYHLIIIAHIYEIATSILLKVCTGLEPDMADPNPTGRVRTVRRNLSAFDVGIMPGAFEMR